MNREIKFRAWDNENEVMVYSNSGSDEYIWQIDMNGITLIEHQVDDDAHNYYPRIEGAIIMQFTGLKDKEGKDIYEGDIITKPLYSNCIVIWNENICAFQYAYHAVGKGTAIGGRMTNTLYSHEEYEVIGNIYESPELLK